MSKVAPHPRANLQPASLPNAGMRHLHALGEDLLRKIRRLEKKLSDPSDAENATDDQKDAAWLARMITAWRRDPCTCTLSLFLSLEPRRWP